jgi:uncharacterized membrane protein
MSDLPARSGRTQHGRTRQAGQRGGKPPQDGPRAGLQDGPQPGPARRGRAPSTRPPGTARPGLLRRRPLHPPLTDFPIAAYVFAAAFDLISVLGHRHAWAAGFWHAGTFVLVAGVGICLLTVTTGFIDLLRLAEAGSRVARAVTAHVGVMAAVFMIGSADLAWRLADYRSHTATPAGLAVITVTSAVGVCIGAGYGGQLVFSLGLGVRPAGAGPEHPPAAIAAGDPGQP